MNERYRPHRRPLVSRAVLGIGMFATFGICGTVAFYPQAKSAGQVTTAVGTKDVLDPVEPRSIIETGATTPEGEPIGIPGERVETYLLVGSDTRKGVKETDSDFGAMGTEEEGGASHADSIMLLRHNLDTGEAAILSIPRDLWVYIEPLGRRERINVAQQKGVATLVLTLQDSLDLEINHFIEVNFQGFKQLVDAVGGVPVCFNYPTRDVNSGLNISEVGCPLLTGVQSLQYTRSRHFEQFIDGEWKKDPRSDFGRIDRQQQFILAAVNRAQGKLGENAAFFTDDLFGAAKAALTLDDTGIDLYDLKARFQGLSSDQLKRYTLPVVDERIDGKQVLLLDKKRSLAILDYFQGVTDVPPSTKG